jgi:hypothetical protein
MGHRRDLRSCTVPPRKRSRHLPSLSAFDWNPGSGSEPQPRINCTGIGLPQHSQPCALVMTQKSFGRRNDPSRASSVATGSSSISAAGSSTDGSSKAVVLSSAAASFLAFAALGYFLTPSGTPRVDAAPPASTIADARPAPVECRGKPDCKNEYSVELRCGEGEEPKTTSVMATSAEAASITAERYNRGCRTRRTFFLAVMTPGGAPSSAKVAAAAAPVAKPAEPVRYSIGGRRRGRR